MKHQLASELPLPIGRNPPKSRNIIKISIFLLTFIPLYFTYFHNKLALPFSTINTNTPPYQKLDAPLRNQTDGGDAVAGNLLQPEKSPRSATKPDKEPSSQTILEKPITSPDPAQNKTLVGSNTKQCDLFTGEWVPNPDGPYYTNLTCDAIQDHQNCMRYGRPDTGFLKWKWKPDHCELPVFDPTRFLELVRGKSMAFVGDSVARNHMQSLVCLLSRVAHPVDLSNPTDQNRLYVYKEYDFNLSISWAPFLVKFENTNADDEKSAFRLYLDEPDQNWTTKIEQAHYVIISAGPWFFRPTYFYLDHILTACLNCPESNITHLTHTFSYQWAFKTALRAINDAHNFKGVTFLRTYAPSHFEGGEFYNGGNCVRIRPFKRNETTLEGRALDLYSIQLEELEKARNSGRRNSRKFRLFDATKPMVLRPDGHPSKYGHPPGANVVLYNDCVHWCLPGPIDAWNDLFQELLIREIQN